MCVIEREDLPIVCQVQGSRFRVKGSEERVCHSLSTIPKASNPQAELAQSGPMVPGGECSEAWLSEHSEAAYDL